VQSSGAHVANRIRQLAVDGDIQMTGFTHASSFDNYLIPDSRRQNPRGVLPHARTLIVCGVYIGGYRIPNWDDPSTGRTSRLFLSGFYSDVVDPLKKIRSYLREEGFSAVLCDSLQSDTVLSSRLGVSLQTHLSLWMVTSVKRIGAAPAAPVRKPARQMPLPTLIV
jgi:hypothetical protein